MKFLLVAINAKYIHSNPAVYSLRAYAGESLWKNIEIAEYTINQNIQDIISDIYVRKADVIGFSCYIWNWKMVQELIVELPKLSPDTDIWLGGPEVTYHPEKILEKYPEVTGIMIGEGEVTFKEVLQRYLSANQSGGRQGDKPGYGCISAEDISGLYLKKGYTGIRELTDISKIPFLYDDLEPFENKIIYYETSRGCPYRCSYCLSSIDKRVRLRDIDIVKRELQYFLDNRVTQVKFVDRTFNCNHEHAMEIWKYIYEHDNGVTNFHFEIAGDILRQEEIELLNRFRPGLAQLEIGVQSTNSDTICAINRVMDVNHLEKIVCDIRKGNNIHQHLDLIAGLPFENYESFKKSFNRVYFMKPDQLQLGFLKVLKGSEMEDRAEEFGIRYMSSPPYEVLSTSWLSYADILKLKKVEEMLELYYNSNQYAHTLPFLLRAFSSPFDMYEKLGEFYERKGYLKNSPARSYRYNVLLEFACEYDKDNAEVYRELLTFDIYLRENAKSRPDFAKDITLSRYKDFSREFYTDAERIAEYLPEYSSYEWKQIQKMTHMEPFVYPVWDMDAMDGLKTENNISGENINYIVFDYQKRNPLNYEAKYICVH